MTEEERLAARATWLNVDPSTLDSLAAEFTPLAGYLIRRMHGSIVPDETVATESLAAIVWGIRESCVYPQHKMEVLVYYGLLVAGYSLLREAHPEWTLRQAKTTERSFMEMSLEPGNNPADEPPPPTLVTGWLQTALDRLVDLAPAGGLGRGLAPSGPSVSGRLERLAAILS